MLFGQGLASSSLALQPSHLCNPSLTDLGPVPKNIFLLRAHFVGGVNRQSIHTSEVIQQKNKQTRGKTPRPARD